jgi:hypothetical protein
MKRKKIIIGAILIVFIAGGAGFFLFGGVDKVKAALQPKSVEQAVTLDGSLVCLPHKDGSETSALSCALGMTTSDGKYYGLSSAQNAELSEAAGSDKKITIKGTLQPSSDATYKMDGIVAVSSFDFK